MCIMRTVSIFILKADFFNPKNFQYFLFENQSLLKYIYTMSKKRNNKTKGSQIGMKIDIFLFELIRINNNEANHIYCEKIHTH